MQKFLVAEHVHAGVLSGSVRVHCPEEIKGLALGQVCCKSMVADKRKEIRCPSPRRDPKHHHVAMSRETRFRVNL